MILVENLSKSFKEKLALKEVSFKISEGQMVSLVGASGSGKSTLLRNLNGLQLADRGTVKIFDTNLQANGKPHSKIRQLRSQIGFIFQQFNLVNRLTVLENVLVGKLARISLERSLLRFFTPSEKEKAIPIFVAIVPNDADVKLNDENTAYRWVDLLEAIDLVPFVGHRQALREIHHDFIEHPQIVEWRLIKNYQNHDY